jgi:hypothetical protein
MTAMAVIEAVRDTFLVCDGYSECSRSHEILHCLAQAPRFSRTLSKNVRGE